MAFSALMTPYINALHDIPTFFMAKLRLNNRHNFSHCIGVAITDQHILTTAKCASNAIPQASSLILNNVFYQVRLITTHPRYQENLKASSHDIALITIQPKANPLPPILEHDYNSHPIYARFHTMTENFDQDIVEVVARFSIMEENYCSSKMGNETCGRDKGQICALVNGVGPCSVLEGSPILDESDGRFKLMGLLSFVPPQNCSSNHFSGVFTNISSHFNWIKHTIYDWKSFLNPRVG